MTVTISEAEGSWEEAVAYGRRRHMTPDTYSRARNFPARIGDRFRPEFIWKAAERSECRIIPCRWRWSLSTDTFVSPLNNLLLFFSR